MVLPKRDLLPWTDVGFWSCVPVIVARDALHKTGRQRPFSYQECNAPLGLTDPAIKKLPFMKGPSHSSYTGLRCHILAPS